MSIKQQVICEKCLAVIEDTKHHDFQGFAVVGNISISNSREPDAVGGGLLGSAVVEGEDVKVSHYHKHCLAGILGIDYIRNR